MINREYFTPRRTRRLVMLGVIGLTLGFIFAQSMKGGEASTSDSDAVTNILSMVFSEDGLIGAFVLRNVRKLAHFFEYGVLGIECAVYVLSFSERKVVGGFRATVFAVMAALIDETIQIFSGRGPMIADVWLDVLGFVTLGGCAVLAWLIVSSVRGRKIRPKESE